MFYPPKSSSLLNSQSDFSNGRLASNWLLVKPIPGNSVRSRGYLPGKCLSSVRASNRLDLQN